jgi:hypothetical protein
MPTRISGTSRVLTGATALVLITAALGCGVLDQAKNLVDTAGVLGDFADRLGKASALTYTAEYKVSGQDEKGKAKEEPTVTLVQQPPNAAFVTDDGRFIFTPDFIYVCDTDKGKMTCHKSPNQAQDVTAADAGLITGVAGPFFVTPELALGLIAAAAFVPGADVAESEKTIAGQKSLCANVTNLEKAGSTANPGDNLHDFSVCVTEDGVLASFSGSLKSGETASVELTSFSAEADKAAFAPPAGAKIVEVGATPQPS